MKRKLKLHKRYVWNSKEFYWQVENTDYYLSSDKESVYKFIPYTEDEGKEDVELKESNSSGGLWTMIEIDTAIIKDIIEL